MSENRKKMYQRLIDGFLSLEFVFGVEKFVEFTYACLGWMDREKLKCSCLRSKCHNHSFFFLYGDNEIPFIMIWYQTKISCVE